MDYDSFISLCDTNVTNAVSVPIDSKEGYRKLKLISGKNIYLIREKLIYFQKKIVFEHIVNGRELNPYITYVYVLMDGIRDSTVTKEEGDMSSVRWGDILDVLGEIKDTNSLMKVKTDFEVLYSNLFDFSKACSRLIKKGYPIIERDDEFFFDEKSNQTLTFEINKLAVSVGGSNVLKAVFNSISNRYDSLQRRFHVYRSLSMGLDRPSPEIPWGYLIALGVKHSNYLGDREGVNNFSELVQLLQDIVSVFEVQDYSPYESWYVDRHGLTKFLSDEVVFDNLYCISQMHNDYVSEILNYVVNSAECSNVVSYGFTIKKIYRCGLSLLNHSLEKQITKIDFNGVVGLLGLNKGQATDMIKKILLNPTPNKNLEFPPKSTEIDNSFNQLLPIGSDYLLMPKPLSSLAFLNNTLNSIITPGGVRNKNNDAALGHVIERFVKEKLDNCGIQFYSGDYTSKDGLVYGESDITIETKTSLIFIEIKKKGLNRLSMSGVDYSILSDLGGSLIHAASQCFKAERVLRCDGEIVLDGMPPIKYQSQRIIKIALTLYDYGSLQDKMTIRSIMTNSLGASFKVSDSKLDKSLKGWREHIEELSEHIKKLDEHGQLDDEPYHNLFFMSIPQLLMILEDASSSEDLEKTLRTLSSISHSTRDFYKEYSLCKTYIK